jgi:hypothetical protein
MDVSAYLAVADAGIIGFVVALVGIRALARGDILGPVVFEGEPGVNDPPPRAVLDHLGDGGETLRNTHLGRLLRHEGVSVYAEPPLLASLLGWEEALLRRVRATLGTKQSLNLLF